jgi:hypothetical protein
VNGRGGRNAAEVKLVDGMWTENQRRCVGAFPAWPITDAGELNP